MRACAAEREAAVRAAFAEQAEWCVELGSPFTALLCRLISVQLDRSTEFGRRVLDWPGRPRGGGDALPMRVCGALHAAVRRGEAPRLAALYPPAPPPRDEELWRELSAALDSAALLPWLERPPQTNEVGRSAVLMAGLLELAARHRLAIELLELGASAGLNLNLDRYSYALGGLEAGDPASPLRLEPEWKGPPPPAARVEIASRRGVDLSPLDPLADSDRLLAYVWPDQTDRLARLEAALAVAEAHPPSVDRGDAAEWLEARLREPPPGGVARVVLHSVAYQYFPGETRARIISALEAAGEAAGEATPLAWLRMELEPGERAYSLTLRVWPGGEDRRLAWCHPHGASIEWISDRAR